ncbi:MAG: hypothetical protein MZV64_42425 [Ignavibacteriales bacterium]|nr:hypothetical protein [Ignavibacteriales bacterium]
MPSAPRDVPLPWLIDVPARGLPSPSTSKRDQVAVAEPRVPERRCRPGRRPPGR